MSKTEKPKSIPVASIKSLGGIAPEFALTVAVPRLDGTSVELKLRGKGMRKSEWLTLRDQHLQELKGNDQPVADAEFSFARLIGERTQEASELVCKGLAGWDLEDAFTPASLIELEDVLPGAINAILSAYDGALFHGRLGN